jgi:hypothetical protein
MRSKNVGEIDPKRKGIIHFLCAILALAKKRQIFGKEKN